MTAGGTQGARAARGEAADDASDARACARIVRAHARTFALASHFLPARKRRATYALYAFCRVADDIVDECGPSDADAARRLGELRRALDRALAGRPDSPVLRELAWAVGAFGVPAATLHELVAGVARDLRPSRYETWGELAAYCEGVASSVGEMCAYVLGVPGGPDTLRRALRYARTLGVAMQLTNILRDVGEDARRGRCYLPTEDLAAFGLTPDDVLRAAHDPRRLAADERWRPFVAFEVGRARALYAAADPGLAMLADDARRCAWACSYGYAAILGAIEAQGHDTLTRRARVSHAARAGILLGAWRAPARLERMDIPADDGPLVPWDGARAPELARLA